MAQLWKQQLTSGDGEHYWLNLGFGTCHFIQPGTPWQLI
jgi:hypothetical protein